MKCVRMYKEGRGGGPVKPLCMRAEPGRVDRQCTGPVQWSYLVRCALDEFMPRIVLDHVVAKR